MTMGELAKLFNEEKHIDADLTVVPMRGWLRGDWFDSTGAIWINPSPNLRSLEEATLYPGVALIEGTGVSVGRGTDMPFQVIGSPYFTGKELASYLNARNIPGVRFVPTTFTPTSGPFARRECYGVNIIVTNREELDAPELGIELAAALHKLYPLGYDLSKMNQLLVEQSDLCRDPGRRGPQSHRRRLARRARPVHGCAGEVPAVLIETVANWKETTQRIVVSSSSGASSRRRLKTPLVSRYITI